jgi:hypothetical protein
MTLQDFTPGQVLNCSDMHAGDYRLTVLKVGAKQVSVIPTDGNPNASARRSYPVKSLEKMIKTRVTPSK